MNVRVDEPWEHHGPIEVNNFGSRIGQPPNRFVRSDSHDAIACYCYRLYDTKFSINRDNLAIQKNTIDPLRHTQLSAVATSK